MKIELYVRIPLTYNTPVDKMLHDNICWKPLLEKWIRRELDKFIYIYYKLKTKAGVNQWMALFEVTERWL